MVSSTISFFILRTLKKGINDWIKTKTKHDRLLSFFNNTGACLIDLKKFALSPRFFLRGGGRLYIGYIVSSCNSFLSYPSKAKDIQSLRCTSLVIFNKTKHFFPGLSLIPM